MATIVEPLTASIAERVRLEREARTWSLADLAARSGVSRAMISKIERCEASPTATVLVRLATAFDLTLAGLIARAEGAGADPVVRSSEQSVWRDPASGYVRRQIFERMDHPVEVVQVDLPAQARVGMPASSYAQIRQVVLVLEGELTIEQQHARYQLGAGDAFGFGPPCDTTFANESDRACVYIVVLARR